MAIYNKVVENISEERHMMKVMEEIHELGEVLMKYMNKAPEYRPKKEKIIEEMGDLMYRMTVLAIKMDVQKEVTERFDEKMEQINKWYKEKYEKTN